MVIRKRSFGSVTIFSLDREEALRRLCAGAAALGVERPEVEEVWLFGSLARGDAVPGSDADIVVVLTDSLLPFFDRARGYGLGYCGIGVDLFAYTRAELEELATHRRQFYRTFMAARMPLYRREAVPAENP